MNRFSPLVLSLLALAACDDPVRPERATPLAPPQLTVGGGSVTITDLGGPPGSNNWSEVYDLNDNGQVVGYSLTALGSRAVLWTPGGGWRDLGSLESNTTSSSRARGINASGQVTGYSRTASGETHAFLWTETGGMQDLGKVTGSLYSDAWGINNLGHVVGTSPIRIPGYQLDRAFLWTPAAGMQDLGTLGGLASHAYAINDQGQVVGWTDVATGHRHAFLWTAAGGMQDLGTLGGTWSQATGINNAGQVVGSAATATGEVHAFRWTAAGGMQDLGTLGGVHSFAEDVNDQGHVVGYSNTACDCEAELYHAFRWTATGGMQDLGTLPGDFPGTSRALAVNNRGQVVGESSSSHFMRPALWTILSRLPVSIDIKPGAEPNSVSLTDQGNAKIPVAVLSTPAFDARLVVPTSVQLGETAVSARRNGSLFASLADADGDGDLDLVVHFDRALLVANGDLTTATTELTLIADLTGGRQVAGRDAVRVVP